MDATVQVTRASSQRMRALEGANNVRRARARLKRRVAQGELEVGQILLDCPSEARSMTVSDLLMSQAHWGAIRSRKTLAVLAVSERKSVGSMTVRQCRALAALLDSSV